MTAETLLPCPFCGEAPDNATSSGNLVCCWGKNERCGHRGLVMTRESWQTRPEDKEVYRKEVRPTFRALSAIATITRKDGV